jgi:phytoene desaturase
MKNKVAIIGAGIGGIATSLRLTAKGYEVHVFEKNNKPGGKLYQIEKDGFRFDTGPSLFTMPFFVDELFQLFDENPRKHFNYNQLENICRYFWNDKTIINSYSDLNLFARELEEKASEDANKVLKFLDKSKKLYNLTAEVFLYNSLHRWQNYFKKAYLKMGMQMYKIDSLTKMSKRNNDFFNSSKTAQIFNRYATYNGSDPYQAPATLNVIAHLEHNVGAFFPEKGMYDIVNSLVDLAKRKGVHFHYNSRVDELQVKNNQVEGLKVDGSFQEFDFVVNDTDISYFYKNIFKEEHKFNKQYKRERSTSALIFYWGVKGEYPQLDIHNILFAEDYQDEFNHLFHLKKMYSDPTIYIFISSKKVKSDAPDGCENWFVMINTPANVNHNWDEIIPEMKKKFRKKF